MKNKLTTLLPVYTIIISLFLIAAHGGSRAVTVLSENTTSEIQSCIIIDPGHGGEDGGAVSCTGIPESKLNLEIALRLEDMLHFLGIDTYMIRRTDCSVYTKGSTISARKASDLRERVRTINELNPAVLLSIHQNYFTDSRYSGPQVFYGKSQLSASFAGVMQSALNVNLAPASNRKEKSADGIYLMEHITCTGALIECGFISNPHEEAKLRSPDYQKKLCAVIAATAVRFLSLDCQTNE